MTPPAPLGLIHRFEPANVRGAPHLLLLHGAGGDENSLVPLGKAIAPGASLLTPRGPVVEEGMARFFGRRRDGTPDMDDLVLRTQELANFVEQASAEYKIPRGQLVIVGYSNGGAIAASLFLHSPQLLAGAVLMRSMLPATPSMQIDLGRRPVLLLSGTTDPIVATDEATELADIFRNANSEVTLHWETAGQPLTQGDVLMAFDWMRRFFTIARNPH